MSERSVPDIVDRIRIDLQIARQAERDSRAAPTTRQRDEAVTIYVHTVDGIVRDLGELEARGVLDEVEDYLGQRYGG